jgi:hypothetical protein
MGGYTILADRVVTVRIAPRDTIAPGSRLFVALDVALQANRRSLRRSLPTFQRRRFCSAATIRSTRRPTAFVALRNMLKPSDPDAIYHGNAERLLPRVRSKPHERTSGM